MRLLLATLPAESAATDAAALAAAVGDLGSLATVMVCATVVLVFLARGGFAWLTAREARLTAQGAHQPARTTTPPGGTPSTTAQVTALGIRLDAIEARLHADVRGLDERARALEAAAAGTRVGLESMQGELRRGMDGLRDQNTALTEKLDELTRAVDRLAGRNEMHPFGNPKTGG